MNNISNNSSSSRTTGHTTNPYNIQEVSQEQTESKLQMAPIGAWVLRTSPQNGFHYLTVKLTETYNEHYLVQKESLWYQMDEETNARISKGFTFDGLLKECEARPHLQQIINSSTDQSLKSLNFTASPHFHNITKQEAKEGLQGKQPGTYLFRPSDSKADNSIIVSFVEKSGSLAHQTIQLTSQTYKSIAHYIETHPSTLITPYRQDSPVAAAVTFRLALPNKTDGTLTAEYHQLPQNLEANQQCSIASDAHNKEKNRFTNVLPFNENAFIEGNFYYNASKLFEGRAIAAQGPEEKHRDDFWKMIWLSNSRSIAMLTKTNECCEYWPAVKGELKCGDITIKSVSEEIKENIIIRKLCINEERTVTHYQFNHWPDHGTASPEVMMPLVKFLSGTFTQNNPIVVHCRAGIGRTGTLLASLFSYQKIRENSSKGLDTGLYYETAHEIRKGRMGAIQSSEQYICGYRTLLALLESLD